MGSKALKEAERVSTSNGTRSNRTKVDSQPAVPKTLLDDDMSEDDSGFDRSNGVSLNLQEESAADLGFKVNEEYARRFEHNKKREELHRRKPTILITY